MVVNIIIPALWGRGRRIENSLAALATQSVEFRLNKTLPQNNDSKNECFKGPSVALVTVAWQTRRSTFSEETAMGGSLQTDHCFPRMHLGRGRRRVDRGGGAAEYYL